MNPYRSERPCGPLAIQADGEDVRKLENHQEKIGGTRRRIMEARYPSSENHAAKVTARRTHLADLGNRLDRGSCFLEKYCC